jgi:hypothetical protein
VSDGEDEMTRGTTGGLQRALRMSVARVPALQSMRSRGWFDGLHL